MTQRSDTPFPESLLEEPSLRRHIADATSGLRGVVSPKVPVYVLCSDERLGDRDQAAAVLEGLAQHFAATGRTLEPHYLNTQSAEGSLALLSPMIEQTLHGGEAPVILGVGPSSASMLHQAVSSPWPVRPLFAYTGHQLPSSSGEGAPSLPYDKLDILAVPSYLAPQVTQLHGERLPSFPHVIFTSGVAHHLKREDCAADFQRMQASAPDAPSIPPLKQMGQASYLGVLLPGDTLDSDQRSYTYTAAEAFLHGQTLGQIARQQNQCVLVAPSARTGQHARKEGQALHEASPAVDEVSQAFLYGLQSAGLEAGRGYHFYPLEASGKEGPKAFRAIIGAVDATPGSRILAGADSVSNISALSDILPEKLGVIIGEHAMTPQHWYHLYQQLANHPLQVLDMQAAMEQAATGEKQSDALLVSGKVWAGRNQISLPAAAPTVPAAAQIAESITRHYEEREQAPSFQRQLATRGGGGSLPGKMR
jgi:hypothetical protein